ncbi:holin family protein [Aquicoccus sp. G2-2]|uniref:holin family protein n=1 Tax=Aquicoccus sp. G2-2 TaxID=3092120 RepID=UPI002ADF5503|nr:holin family protein [Aquicoccus sp. G2-2]MEA1113355.1 holin family protein [Aquicoccus sp. G2-2]
MGVIERVLALLFGNERNVLKDTAEVFRENAEGASARATQMQEQALTQFGGEFRVEPRGLFDRVMDALNRVPRPALALGTLALFIAAMVDPVWFASRMQGIALVPEPLWWLLGAIVSFYFGARHQAKGQDFQRQISRTLLAVPQVVSNLKSLDALERGAGSPGEAATGLDARVALEATEPEANPALRDWRREYEYEGR